MNKYCSLLKSRAALRTILGVALLIALTLNSFGQVDSDCSKLVDLIEKTYGFRPSKLSEDEKTKKSKEMDRVWNLVKSDKNLYVPCLKKELQKPEADNFFLFDAANLLFQLDQGEESKRRIATIYGKVYLEDVNLEFWMRYVATLGFQGFDTSSAGENWLKAKDPKYYLPAHGTRPVDKLVGAYIIFGGMDEKFAAPKLINIAKRKDHPGRAIAVELLAQIQTKDALKALGELIDSMKTRADINAVSNGLKSVPIIKPREGKPKHSRVEYIAAFKDLAEAKPTKFLKMVSEVSDGEKDAIVVLEKGDVPLIRKARRFFAAMSNPHSPEYYRVFSGIIAAVNKKKSK